MNKITKILAVVAVMTNILTAVSAVPEVEGVSFDPAFISAGDEVGISVNLRELRDRPGSSWDTSKNLKASIAPDNRLAEKYVEIVEQNDSTIGFLQPEGVFNRKFKVDVDSDAPTGDYKFEVRMKYVDAETGEGSSVVYKESFVMPVESEGVDVTIALLDTNPKTLRPGDDESSLNFRAINTGNKPVKELEIYPEFPEGFEPSHSGYDHFFIGRLEPGDSREFSVKTDIDEETSLGKHSIEFRNVFEDPDSNQYKMDSEEILRLDGRPYLEIEQSEVDLKAGESGKVLFTIRNTGEQDAESVTARMVLERAQPFTPSDRSEYIGEIESGESVKSSFDVRAGSDASLREHFLKVELRASGDSTEGDRSVYTFDRNVSVDITEGEDSLLMYSGFGLSLAVLGIAFYRFTGGGRDKN